MSWFFYLCVIHKTKKNHVRLLTQPSVPLYISQPSSIPLSTPPYPSSPFGTPWVPLSTPQHPSIFLSTPQCPSAPLSTSCWQFWKMFIGCDLCFIAMNLHFYITTDSEILTLINFTISKYWFPISVLLDWGVLKHGYPKNEVMMSHKRSLIAINKHCRVH